MRLLVDQNVPRAVVQALRDQEHDVVWVQEAHPGASDVDLLRRDQHQERIVITFDTDFGTLAFHEQRSAAAGILFFRLPPTSPDALAQVVSETIRSRDDWAGHFTVVTDTRIRMRPLPS